MPSLNEHVKDVRDFDDCNMSLNDWEYVVEGGQHVLLAVTAVAHSECCAEGTLLRVSKEQLLGSLHGHITEADRQKKASIHLRRQGLHQWLAPYIDLPRATDVCCNAKDIHLLVQRTLQSGKIPPHRVPYWESNEKPPQERTTLSCSFVRDYRKMQCSKYCWSIELKPKAGYTAISPCVELLRAYKFQHSRCTLLSSCAVDNDRSKNYNPLDLFSGCYQRILHALQCLALSTATTTQPVYKPRKLLSVWQSGVPHQPASSPHDSFWIPCVATILHHEAFLRQLQALQRLDLIDADGAIVLYHHLKLELGTGRLEALLEAPIELLQPQQELTALHPLLKDCPIPLPDDSKDRDGLLDFCRLVASFREEHLTHTEARQRALALLRTLTVPAGCFLLQLWLLSLSMCDVSCFIALWPAAAAPEDQSNNIQHCPSVQQEQPTKTDTTCVVRHVTSQSPMAPGRVCVETKDRPVDSVVWEYAIKLIDFDPKPAAKLRTRHEKEQQLEDWVLHGSRK